MTDPKTDPKTEMLSGPKRSRRFGTNLLITLPTPHGENCSWNCIYCPMRAKRASLRLSHSIRKSLNQELTEALRKYPQIDSLILSGTSDPTAHPEFSEIVQDIVALRQEFRGQWIFHCLTNGSGLKHKKTQKACAHIDQIWIKLDCADHSLFLATHHPSEQAGPLEEHILRLKQVPHLNLQTTLWRYPGHFSKQNWSPENLSGLLKIYEALKPARLHLTTLRNWTLHSHLQPVSYTDLEAFALRVSELGILVDIYP